MKWAVVDDRSYSNLRILFLKVSLTNAMNFESKVILVTGASSGIGADAARYLAKLGGKVAIIGRNERRLFDVAALIESDGSEKPMALVADVTKDATKIIDQTIEHFGKLDVLVNSAGVFGEHNTETMKLCAFDEMFNINVRSILELAQLAAPHLAQTRGNIVNVSSTSGLKPAPNMLAYCVSKAALDQATKCMALDLAAKGVRVNAINPAAIRTPLYQVLGISAKEENELFETYKSRYPIGRVGEVSDTSYAIAYLASAAASFITGVLHPVDGGALPAGFD